MSAKESRMGQLLEKLLAHETKQCEARKQPLPKFNNPASDEEIRELERLVGVHLPADYKDLVKVTNGAQNFTLIGWRFCSVAEAAEIWKDNSEQYPQSSSMTKQKDLRIDNTPDRGTTPQVKKNHWNDKWVPVFYAPRNHNYICMDFDPAPGGTPGQLIGYHSGVYRGQISKTLFEGFARIAKDKLSETMAKPKNDEPSWVDWMVSKVVDAFKPRQK